MPTQFQLVGRMNIFPHTWGSQSRWPGKSLCRNKIHSVHWENLPCVVHTLQIWVSRHSVQTIQLIYKYIKEGNKWRYKEKYPWLYPSDERKYMTDMEILEKYMDLEKSCLTEKEKMEVMDMLYKYKEAFSLRDEIGTCPNIEIEIDITDKSPFFIRPYHVKEEDKK